VQKADRNVKFPGREIFRADRYLIAPTHILQADVSRDTVEHNIGEVKAPGS
jgi:hypothetical protein